MSEWFARPVLHVSNVPASLEFYVERLGFTVAWRYKEADRTRVAQVDRSSCAIILSDQWPDKVGTGMLFVSLNVDPPDYDTSVAALDALRAELESRGVLVRDGQWGYRVLIVPDPDGNELYFNYPDQST
jgi:catechol 2,3-dioxygenase-like lactoylglutathione lyase family enzyme